jgi:predicted transcriptional regulator
MGKIIHMVFSESAEGSFKQAIKIKSIVADKLIALYDNLSNGVINDLTDLKSRKMWLNELNGEENYIYYDLNDITENYNKFHNDISEINDGDIVYLWHGHCDREICGMIYTLHLLKDKAINAYIVNVSDKIVENNHGMVVEIIASSATEIVPEKLGVYLKLARKIERDEYNDLVTQWTDLLKENSLLRSYVNGKMVSISEDYFDKDILKFTDKKYMKESRIFCEALANIEPRITEAYMFWRIKELVRLGKMSFKGKFGAIREMQICITDKGLEYLSGFHDSMNFWNERKRAGINRR